MTDIHPLLGHPDAPDWSRLNQPFGSIEPTTPTPSQRLGSAASSALIAAGAQPYVANHLVNGVGNLLGMTPVAAPIFAANLIDANRRNDVGSAVQAMAGLIPGGAAEGAVMKDAFDPSAIADHLSRLAQDMGFSVGREGSNLSNSEYLHLDHPNLESPLKIRVADHSLPPSYPNSANVEVGPHGEATGWANAIDWLARKIGVQTPAPAVSQLAADEAEAARLKQLQDDRTAAYLSGQQARVHALQNAANSPNAARIAELTTQLADPSITGNRRKKLNGKLRDILGYTGG